MTTFVPPLLAEAKFGPESGEKKNAKLSVPRGRVGNVGRVKSFSPSPNPEKNEQGALTFLKYEVDWIARE